LHYLGLVLSVAKHGCCDAYLFCRHILSLTPSDQISQGNPLLSNFDLSQDGFPFRKDIPTIIETRRALLSDVLIFDILLSSGGVRNSHVLYPPSDPASLSALLDAIAQSTYDSLKKDCLVYFLIKWHEFKIDGSGGDKMKEEIFVQERCIPPQFVLLADAYWYLDTGSDVEVRDMP
jgi:hypothetical protein